MSKVSYIPKDYNSVTPYLIVKDAAKAIDYYKKVFGATETVRMNGPDGKVGSPVSLYVYLPDVDSVVKRAEAEGAKILKPVQDQFYGDRNGFIQDPFGHLWGIATHVEDVSPADMKERMKKMMPAA
jgi:PhnB protein